MPTNHRLSPALLETVSAMIAEQMGLYFPPERWSELERGLSEVAQVFHCPDVESCARQLIETPLKQRQIEFLATSLTIGETYFFRESKVFEALETQILPELIEARRKGEKRLRIWSAACASGEEIYSVALLLDRLLPDYEDWNITLLATDINPIVLEKAVNGRYREWSFRRTSPATKAQYFKEVEREQYELLPRLRQRVTFAYLNLAAATYPSPFSNTNAMDVILCRNVLLYFTPSQVTRTIEKLFQCLLPQGWLAVSQTEVSHLNFSQFTAQNLAGALLYRKEEQVRLRTPPPPVVGIALPVPIAPAPALAVPAPIPPAISSGQAVQRARECANEGQLAQAADWCEQALENDKLNASVHYLHAVIAQERGLLAQARQSFRRTLFLDPEFALAHYALGNLSLRDGRREESQRHFLNALKLLEALAAETVLPEGGGVTAEILAEFIATTHLRK